MKASTAGGVGPSINAVCRQARHALRHPVSATRRLLEGPQGFQTAPWRKLELAAGAHPRILEAGAADGSDTRLLAKLGGGAACVVALEPVPEAYKRLQEQVGQLENVKTLQSALSSGRGELQMWISAGAGGTDSSSLMDPSQHSYHFPSISFDHQTTVQSLSIDDVLQELEIEAFDLLWLDLQGIELEVLHHSPIALRRAKAIYLEVSRVRLYEQAPIYREVKSFLRRHRYQVTHERVGSVSGNALFQRVVR